MSSHSIEASEATERSPIDPERYKLYQIGCLALTTREEETLMLHGGPSTKQEVESGQVPYVVRSPEELLNMIWRGVVDAAVAGARGI